MTVDRLSARSVSDYTVKMAIYEIGGRLGHTYSPVVEKGKKAGDMWPNGNGSKWKSKV